MILDILHSLILLTLVIQIMLVHNKLNDIIAFLMQFQDDQDDHNNSN